jgi:hypothetical protein
VDEIVDKPPFVAATSALACPITGTKTPQGEREPGAPHRDARPVSGPSRRLRPGFVVPRSREEGGSLTDSRTLDRGPSSEAVEFVRFCYRRRRIGWPELYDEMCAVAGRGLYRGWGPDELGAEGIGFSLFEMHTLASLVSRVIAEER